MESDDGAKKGPLVGREIYTFREGDAWIAAWARFDVVAQGATEREAFDRLIRTIAYQAIGDGEDGNLKTFGTCPVMRDDLRTRWARQHALSHPELRLLQ